MNQLNKESKKVYIYKLDEIIFHVLEYSKIVVIVLDISIKNYIAISITHIHIHNSPVIKTLYYIINIISTEAKLFAIRCHINQTTQIANINHIIIITDSIHVVKRIFNLSVHLYQIQSSTILRKLREFFGKDQNNCIEFWDCPSCNNWALHCIVDKETKQFNLVLIFLCKSSWDFNRKNKYNSILNS